MVHKMIHKMIPEEIRLSIVNIALDKNIAVMVESESSKLSIAVSMLEEVLDFRNRNHMGETQSTKKAIPFLVDSPNLVRARWRNLNNHSSFRVEKERPERKGQKWMDLAKKLTTHDVLVMTVDTLSELIGMNCIGMAEIPILLFDDCYCANESHPFYKFMMAHYHSVPEGTRRPRVLGLTTFLFTNGPCEMSARFFSQVFTAEVYAVSLLNSSPWEESVLRYPAQEKYAPWPSFSKLQASFSNKYIKKICAQTLRVNEHLGPYCSALFILRDIKGSIEGKLPCVDLPRALEFVQYFGEHVAEQLSISTYTFPPDQVSPKVRVLLMYLLAIKTYPRRVVVFVNDRSIAVGLQLLIQASKGLESIKCAHLLGDAQKNGTWSTTMSEKERKTALNGFRDGDIHLLIVSEFDKEGFELLPCDTAILFDFCDGYAAHPKFRAIARGLSSQRVVMVEKGGGDGALLDFLAGEAGINQWYRSLNETQSYVRWISTELESSETCPPEPDIMEIQAVEEDPFELSTGTYETKSPDFWLRSDLGWSRSWISLVQLDSTLGVTCPFAIITQAPFPDLHHLPLSLNASIIAHVTSVSQEVQFTQEQIGALLRFTWNILKEISRNVNSGPEDLAFLVAPLNCLPDSISHAWKCFDWTCIYKSPVSIQIACGLQVSDLVVCIKATPSRLYYVKGVHDPMLHLEPLELATGNKHIQEKTVALSSCLAHWLTASFHRSIMLIPSLLAQINMVLLIHEVKAKLDINFVKDEFLIEAFTFSSANPKSNYERLELLGDTFLKLIASVDVFIKSPNASSGELAKKYVAITSNRSMFLGAREKSLPKYFFTKPFDLNKWRPPSNSSTRGIAISLSEKRLADVVEASLAASLFSVGESGSIRCAKAFGILLGEFYSWDDFRNAHSLLCPPTTQNLITNTSYDQIQSILGYSFKNPAYLSDALACLVTIKPKSTLYRLIFLGDALLNYFVVAYIYLKFPDASPGKLTSLKDACLCRRALIQAMDSLNLYSYVPSSWVETGFFSSSGKSFRATGNGIKSILGAIFFDTGFQFEDALAFFNRHVRPLCDNHTSEGRGSFWELMKT